MAVCRVAVWVTGHNVIQDKLIKKIQLQKLINVIHLHMMISCLT